MNTQVISEISPDLDKLETEFMNAGEFVNGVADVFFNMTTFYDDALPRLDQNSISSLMYQCRQQADKCNEVFQNLLVICMDQQKTIEALEAQEQAGKALETGELNEISSE